MEDNEAEASAEQNEDTQVAITTKTRFHATQAPVKSKVKIVQDTADDAQKDLQLNEKKLGNTKGEFDTMEHTLTLALNNMLQEELEEIHHLKDKLRIMEESDEHETVAVKQQIEKVTQIKDTIKKDVTVLNSRIEAAEVDVGYDNQNKSH
eukprot:TRINITY_DN2578_c0_g1_i1.p1 TRINITY_DN2578_c0_g1~~TRINITY_DN2578_c0_g1_i1.p1  ORF type:complete len:150 (+),score=35.91 TRINITY_DN2578_c0_g1_i1:91-540(+)